MSSESSRGGSRLGAGRKAGSGPFGEPTRTIRVPVSRIPNVVAYLHACRPGSPNAPDGTEPGSALALFPRSLAVHPPYRTTRRPQSSVPAGFPSPADDYIEAGLDFNEHLIVSGHRDASFVVRVQGWSMIGAGIFDGDEVIVDRAITPAEGHVVVAIVNGELTIKRLRFKEGKPVLIAENPHFKERRFEEEDTLEIWGVATRVLHKL